MSLVIDLPQSIEGRLEAEAARVGVPVSEYVAYLIQQTIPAQAIDTEEQKRRNAPSLALLRSWLERAEAPATEAEAAEAERDLTEFMRQMNAPRKAAEERLLYPELEQE